MPIEEPSCGTRLSRNSVAVNAQFIVILTSGCSALWFLFCKNSSIIAAISCSLAIKNKQFNGAYSADLRLGTTALIQSAPTVRVCIPHKTRTYAIANSVSTTPRSLVPQGFKNSVPKTRRQEVSRKTRFKSEKTGKPGDFLLSEVRRYIRKTPQTLACSGVFVTVLDRGAPCYWRRERDSNPR